LIIPGSVPPDTAWFACLGLRPSSDELRDAHAYLAALGCTESIEVSPVSGWREAESILRNRDWDARWWQTEDDERTRLLAELIDRLGRTAALEQLSAQPDVDPDVLHHAATIAAARDGCTDAALIRCASGAAAMAAHELALARLAGCGPERLFMRKYRLFEAGRWPLSVLHQHFYLF
jgi:hypothetical protein